MPSIKLERWGPNGSQNPLSFMPESHLCLYYLEVHDYIGVFKTCVEFVNLLCSFVVVCDWSCSEFYGNTIL
jgi:hypothetical protein